MGDSYTKLPPVTISGLPQASQANVTDQVEVNQSGTSRSVTISQIAQAAMSLPSGATQLNGALYATLFGVDSPANDYAQLYTWNDGGKHGELSLKAYANSTTGSGIAIGMARGTPSAPAAVILGDQAAYIHSKSFDGSSWVLGPNLSLTVDGTPTPGVIPLRVSLNMTATGLAPWDAWSASSNGTTVFGRNSALTINSAGAATFLIAPSFPTPPPGTSSTVGATTAFVTTAVATGVSGYLPLTGGQLTGPLGIGRAPTALLDVAGNVSGISTVIFANTNGGPISSQFIQQDSGSIRVTRELSFLIGLGSLAERGVGVTVRQSNFDAQFFGNSDGSLNQFGIVNQQAIFYGTTSGQTRVQAQAAAPNITITLPATSGTLALTSSLNGYLPLSGGTITGPLIYSAPANAVDKKKFKTFVDSTGDFFVQSLTDADAAQFTWAFKRDARAGYTSIPGWLQIQPPLNTASSDPLLQESPIVSFFSPAGPADHRQWHLWVSSTDVEAFRIEATADDYETVQAGWYLRRNGATTLPGLLTGTTATFSAAPAYPNNTTSVATTAFVTAALAAGGGGGAPTGPAGGGLSGTYPNPQIKPSVTNGQVLTTVGGVSAWATPAASGGTVTTTSVVSANGLAGTVATATTTPAITLSTTVTGMLKGNGTAISAGTAGTDYMTPANVSAAYQPLDADLTALAGLNATAGLVEQTAAATYTKRLIGVANTTDIPTRANADARYAPISVNGTVTSTSVVSANGFAGTVATATTTPAITLSTSITGMLKGNGTAISAGVAGTDYVTPGGLTTTLGSYLPLGGGTLTGPLGGTTGTWSGLQTITVADGAQGLLLRGASKGIRVYPASTGTFIEGVDNTGSASYQLLTLSGSAVSMAVSGISKALLDSTGFALVTPLTISMNQPGILFTHPSNAADQKTVRFWEFDDGNVYMSFVNDVGVLQNQFEWSRAGEFISPSNVYVTPNSSGSGYYIAGSARLVAESTDYTSIRAPGTAVNRITVGDDVNPTNYYTNDTHIIRDRALTNIASLTTTAATFSVPVSGTTATFSGVVSTNGFTAGYLAVPQNIQASTYAPVLADSGKHIYHAVGAATATWTIPANGTVAYPIGTTLTMVNDSANNITIAITTDTLVWSPGTTTGSRTLGVGGIATALKVTATRWLISGTGLT